MLSFRVLDEQENIIDNFDSDKVFSEAFPDFTFWYKRNHQEKRQRYYIAKIFDIQEGGVENFVINCVNPFLL